MPPETEVIACPACRHLLRVPADWLGQAVQCPECKAKFAAPVRDGDRLTDPVLLAPPPGAPAAAPAKGRADPLLLLPAFGLMFVGAAAFFTNGFLFVKFLTDADGGKGWVLAQLPAMRKAGFGADDPAGEQEKLDDQRAAELAPKLRWVWLASAAAGAMTFAGGLSVVRRKNPRLARAACVVASLNAPNLCCVPGAVFGLWGLLMLMSDEGREHFA